MSFISEISRPLYWDLLEYWCLCLRALIKLIVLIYSPRAPESTPLGTLAVYTEWEKVGPELDTNNYANNPFDLIPR